MESIQSIGLGKQNPQSSQAVRAWASWSLGKEEHRIALVKGRHLIGDSSFCKIRVGYGDNICGFLDISQTSPTIKCTSARPSMFADGKKMTIGDTVTIGDVIEVTVGRTPITISIASIIDQETLVDHLPFKSDSSISESSSDQGDRTKLQDADSIRRNLAKSLLKKLNLKDMSLEKLDSPEVREQARLKLRKLISDLKIPPTLNIDKDTLEKEVYDEITGLGPLEPLLSDENITEIMVNSKDQIFIEKSGKLIAADIRFSSDQALINIIDRIVSSIGRRIDTSSPIVDARLLDGSRVNAMIPPLAIKGPNITIRRFSKDPISMSKLVGWGSLTTTMADFLQLLVQEHKNMIVSGGTGSGKTTLLNALSNFIPNNERIITVEDAAELQLQQEHLISLESRPANLEGKGAISIRDLVRNTLRMRPDRIIVGECRGGEALDMLQAMNTGHDGSMTTAHANSPIDMLRRLETMVLMSGMELPLSAIREQIASALTIIVQQTRRKTGRRLITDISWVHSLDKKSKEYVVYPLYSRDKKDNLTAHTKNIQNLWQEEDLNGTWESYCKSEDQR